MLQRPWWCGASQHCKITVVGQSRTQCRPLATCTLTAGRSGSHSPAALDARSSFCLAGAVAASMGTCGSAICLRQRGPTTKARHESHRPTGQRTSVLCHTRRRQAALVRIRRGARPLPLPPSLRPPQHATAGSASPAAVINASHRHYVAFLMCGPHQPTVGATLCIQAEVGSMSCESHCGAGQRYHDGVHLHEL